MHVGVRQLDREVASVCRSVAVRVAEARDRYLLEQANATKAAALDFDNEEITNEQIPPPNSNVAKPVVEEQQQPLILKDFVSVHLTRENVKEFLGPIKYENEIASRVSVPGVATGKKNKQRKKKFTHTHKKKKKGMAWTQVGGEILFIEVSLSKGSGRIQITGRLGETMQESVRTALSYVRANMVELGLNTHRDHFGEDIEKALRNADLHVS